jgi:ubiquinone/menaquinone biosynthesis C-methylase UbiE
VRRFWEQTPCGSTHTTASEGSPEYFNDIERKRRELEPFIDRYADFAATRGKEVLEIGVGLGTDFVRFARAGAWVTGVDLTERSVDLVRRRLELEGLHGDLRVADAENLPFPDESFDAVYSWGVLHHTPSPSHAIREAIRVLRPTGRLCLMLYARHSWVSYALWARYALLRGRPNRRLGDVIAHHMESEGTSAYTRAELRRMMAPLERLSVEHVATPYDRRVAGPLATWTGARLGWFLVATGRKRRAERG